MTLTNRIEALIKLGEFLQDLNTEEINAICDTAYYANRWFEQENTKLALVGIRDEFLDKEKLISWANHYKFKENSAKKIGLVLAGNIPAVGWNDIQCVFITGNISQIKYSEKDSIIIPFLIKKIIEFEPQFADQFEIVERLKEYDAVIATGSDNTARYFHSYFGKYPHIIRKNRNAVAVLSGDESKEDILNLGKDIFTFFGLGCRNVSKIYIPTDYNFDNFLEILHDNNFIVNNNKYKNNFDYNIALFLLNKVGYKNNGCLIIREDERLTSRIASIHYEFYKDKNDLLEKLQSQKENIQCIVSNISLDNFNVFSFGKAQQPSLMDYADGADTMAFLTSL